MYRRALEAEAARELLSLGVSLTGEDEDAPSLVDGDLAVYVEKGGRTLLTYSDDPGVLSPAVDALALAVRDGALGRLDVDRADGEAVFDTPLARALTAAGFRPSTRGLRLRS